MPLVMPLCYNVVLHLTQLEKMLAWATFIQTLNLQSLQASCLTDKLDNLEVLNAFTMPDPIRMNGNLAPYMIHGLGLRVRS